MARIIVGSYVVRFPLGGFQSWALQWLLGLKRLGHEVYFVEKSGRAEACYDPVARTMSDDCSHGTAAFSALLERYGLEHNWCFVDAHGEYHGMPRARTEAIFRDADAFVDHMRVCEWPEEASWAKMRVMIDAEPAYTQMKMALNAWSGMGLSEYDRYYSVGLNVGSPECTAPAAGKEWGHICDPVVMDLYPVVPAPADGPFTTIMNWRAVKPFIYNGTTYGTKDVEFPKFMDLPRRTRAAMELAIGGEGIPHQQLTASGWRLVDAHSTTLTFDAWRDYIQGSRGEFGVCKNYFVATNSGAFSDRAAVYLASGRPVVMQETGFSSHLPCGTGLFAVRTVEEAAAAIEEIQGNWNYHSRCAREIAAEYLDAGKVLRRFTDELGL